MIKGGVKREFVARSISCLWFGICLLLAGGCEKQSPLLGKWVYVSKTATTSTNTEPGSERGIEFLPGSKFVTFGYKAQGQTMDQYGTYSLISSNRVRLDIQGIQITQDGTNTDMKASPDAKNQKFLKYSPEAQELTEDQSVGEPARFRFLK